MLCKDAFLNLARLGKPEGVAAVLAERERPEVALPSFAIRMHLHALATKVGTFDDRTTTQVRSVKTHADGTTWGLLTSPVLGSGGDLWIVRLGADGRWCEPIFTGVDTAESMAFRRKVRKPFTYQGMTEKELVEGGAWVGKFVGNPDLTRDSEGDGWTDLVEARLGTNPNRADTDGDGIRDSVSHNPRSGCAPFGDAEAVTSAAFDARLRFSGDWPTAPLLVTFPKGFKPFKLTGSEGLIIGCKPDESLPLAALYGEGTGLVDFAPPVGTIKPAKSKHSSRGERSSDLIFWNTAHTEARISVGLYFGGLNGTVYNFRLRKISGRWLVVESKLAEVS